MISDSDNVIVADEMKPKLAENGIDVFKMMNIDENGQMRSFFFDFQYSNGETYETDMSVVDDAFSGIILPYQKRLIESSMVNDNTNVLFFCTKGGFHSYSNANSVINECGMNSIMHETIKVCEYPLETKCVKCVVPKGARYFINHLGEIASDRIKILQ